MLSSWPTSHATLLLVLFVQSAVGNGPNQKVQCPCCTRDFDGIEDVQNFKASLDRMKDPETSELLRANRQQVEKSRAEKAEYQTWRKVVSETMHDVMDWTRMTNEAKDTEVTISDTEVDLSARQKDLNTLREAIADLQTNCDDLRDLTDNSKRWTDDAVRVSRKKMDISQKKVDLSISTSNNADRDLHQVEESLSKHQTEKDELNNKIVELNKLMTNLNARIANMSAKVRILL